MQMIFIKLTHADTGGEIHINAARLELIELVDRTTLSGFHGNKSKPDVVTAIYLEGMPFPVEVKENPDEVFEILTGGSLIIEGPLDEPE